MITNLYTNVCKYKLTFTYMKGNIIVPILIRLKSAVHIVHIKQNLKLQQNDS